jgi:hypothetical protein
MPENSIHPRLKSHTHDPPCWPPIRIAYLIAGEAEDVVPNRLSMKRSKPAEAFLVRHHFHGPKLFGD